jgi:hypothetical protein
MINFFEMFLYLINEIFLFRNINEKLWQRIKSNLLYHLSSANTVSIEYKLSLK